MHPFDEDTCEWLGCPTPLEMYKHQCAYLEDELRETQIRLQSARKNIAGLVQLSDQLAHDKAKAETEVQALRERISATNNEASEHLSFRSIDLITGQRDELFRENQRLLLELSVFRGPRP